MKFGTGVHCYWLVTILTFIFRNSVHWYFFEQIWYQNLKFSKLTKIWYWGTLLHAYYDFNVYFFKVLFIHIFCQICSQNLKFSKLTEIWFRGTLPHAYYGSNVYFFKSFVIHNILGIFGPKIWWYPNWLESSIGVHY